MSFFDLILRDSNGQKHTLQYNPHTSELLSDGTSFIEDVEPHPWVPVDKISPQNPGKKVSSPKRLKIQLGLKCNYKCSYCSQSVHVESAINTNMADAQIFIKNLNQWMEGEPERIEFWGGEPLLYWKKIKFLIQELSKKFTKTQYVIITNGTLIDDEFIEYVKKYDINVAVSHDGPGQALRGDDPFMDPDKSSMIFKLWNERKERMSFNVVLTPQNYDLNEIFLFFKSRLGDDVRVEFEGVVTSYASDPAFSQAFTPKQYEELTENLAKMIFKAKIDNTINKLPHTVLNRIMNFAMSLKYRKPSYSLGQKCGMDKEDSLACDLLGNIMTCQNTTSDKNHRIGHVMLMDQVKLDTSYHWSNRDECSNCPVLQLCGGSCMYLPNDFNWYNSCNNEYSYNMGIFAGALFVLTNGWVLEEVRGKIARPDPELLNKVTPIVKEQKDSYPIIDGWVWEVEYWESDPNYFYLVDLYKHNSEVDKYYHPQEKSTVIPQLLISGIEDPDFIDYIQRNKESLIGQKIPFIEKIGNKWLAKRVGPIHDFEI